MDVDFKLPRLFVDQPLAVSQTVVLPERAHHYLKNVMRRQIGDLIRFFNGQDGEFLGEITAIDKKAVTVSLTRQTRLQPVESGRVHLIFAPIKKARQDLLIEKAVELGVDVFHPILTDHGDIRDINVERTALQMIEAAEQSERLTVPAIAPLRPLRVLLREWDQSVPILAGVERVDAPSISGQVALVKDAGSVAMLIGPGGGWSEAEKTWLMDAAGVVGVNLGDEILRSETAAIAMLSFIKFVRHLKEKTS